ncbi:putative bifunctional diguanylate cyclase/phosphodiesterase [Pseudoalteromonas luteoviolacea]|uniref:Diguanylate cyclase n=1 Tax=Pseudoalteromonas luteoviolacea NCIMB 1942 TaxID=1365253 RepID=A0A166Z528_9GAMM|nr:EAL domain-containing protein [Pseudoalteromonas luteoviolacea]KZN43850.1 hypothetical protein N482_18655 [Pseudoalteromonas luteoviolacea NCIMB 1942]
MNQVTQKLLFSFFFLLVGLSFGIQISQLIENLLFAEAGIYGNEALIELFNYFSLGIVGFVMAIVTGGGVIFLARKKQQEIGFGEHGELYYEVFKESLVAQFLVCENGTFYAVSQGLCAYVNMSEDELIETGIVKLVDEKSFKMFQKWQDGGEEFEQLDLHLDSQSGELAHFIVSLNHTHLSGVFLGQLINIAEQTQIQKQHELLAITLRSVGDGVICADTEGNISFVNPVAEAVLALLDREVVGKPFHEVMSLIDEESKEPICDPMGSAMAQMQTVSLTQLACFRNHLGLEFAIEISCSPIFLGSDQIAGAVLVFQDVTESRLLRKKMAHLAHHDALSGLPNRLLLQDRLIQACKRAKRHKHQFAVIFLDLNKFKLINDTYGHDSGDELLKQVAKKLTSTIRACDTVSRIGGDEFVLLIDAMEDRRNVRHVIDKIFAAASGEYGIKTTSVNISFSAGIALYPNDGDNADTLMKCADSAMYRAKKVGHSNYQFYCTMLDKEAEYCLEREKELVVALACGEFFPYFQPIVNAQSHEIEKLEVLARWRHGDDVVAAEQFIETAEEAGIGIQLSMQVFEQAIVAFADLITHKPSLLLCLNLSVRHLLDGSFPEQIIDLIEKYRLTPSQFELEIAERPLLENADELSDRLVLLSKFGFKLSIDDFGLGQTNPVLLKELHFDSIKIDPSFVSEIYGTEQQDDLALVMINIAKSLGVNCIAEGVESEFQAMTLATHGCNQLQGHFFTTPLSLDEIERILRNG